MAETTLKRHPVRGSIWGLLFGVGLGLLLMVMAIVPLSIPTLIIYAVVNTLLGAAWGMFAPARKPKGVRAAPPPAAMN